MKKILVLLLCACAFSSCATVNRTISYFDRDAARNGDQAARNRYASTDIGSEVDRNTGGSVGYSKRANYTFNLKIGKVKLVNTKYDYILYYEAIGDKMQLQEKINRYGGHADIYTSAAGKHQLISFNPTADGLWVVVHQAVWEGTKWRKTAPLASYMF